MPRIKNPPEGRDVFQFVFSSFFGGYPQLISHPLISIHLIIAHDLSPLSPSFRRASSSNEQEPYGFQGFANPWWLVTGRLPTNCTKACRIASADSIGCPIKTAGWGGMIFTATRLMESVIHGMPAWSKTCRKSILNNLKSHATVITSKELETLPKQDKGSPPKKVRKPKYNSRWLTARIDEASESCWINQSINLTPKPTSQRFWMPSNKSVCPWNCLKCTEMLAVLGDQTKSNGETSCSWRVSSVMGRSLQQSTAATARWKSTNKPTHFLQWSRKFR